MREQQDGHVEDRYRHVRHHPVFGRRPEGEVTTGPGRTPGRAGAGPRRVRPGIAPVSSRPSQPRRPAADGPVPVAPVPFGGVTSIGPAGLDGIAVEGDLADRALRARLRPEPVGVVASWSAPRVLSRRAAPAPGRARILARRWVAGAVLIAVAAIVVVALGLLADAVSAARHPAASVPAAPPPAALVTVEAPGTVWDLAGRLHPAAGPAERAALVGRIVTANSLTTGEVHPGQVLAVPSR